MKKELTIFFTALMFYTRIPCPSNIDHSPDYINKATRYFPLIGWIVGTISYLFFMVGLFLFDVNIAVVLSLIAGVLTTGGFHEDGLADVFDGFGGGWTKSKILDIMKDSRVGAFGAISLVFLFLLKYLALNNFLVKVGTEDYLLIFLIFLTYHAMARLTAIQIVFTSVYSREDEKSKAKPIAKQHTWTEIIGAYFFGLLPLALLCIYEWKYGLVVLSLAILYLRSKRYFEKWIDGYTGDCLGAVEQMAECVCLLSFLSIAKWIALNT